MYKSDLALNKLQWLIGHKTEPNLSFFFSLSPPTQTKTFLLLFSFTPTPCLIFLVLNFITELISLNVYPVSPIEQ